MNAIIAPCVRARGLLARRAAPWFSRGTTTRRCARRPRGLLCAKASVSSATRLRGGVRALPRGRVALREREERDQRHWSLDFYAQHPTIIYPPRRLISRDFGDRKFGRTTDSPHFIGRRVDW